MKNEGVQNGNYYVPIFTVCFLEIVKNDCFLLVVILATAGLKIDELFFIKIHKWERKV